jgi:urease accessory protein
MPCTQRILAKGERAGEIVDTVLLKFADRRRQQGFVFGAKGTCIEFDFPSVPRLRTDDLLLLDDGKVAEVVAEVEPLLEVREKDFAKAARLVWRLGNRHVPVQIVGHRVRMQNLPEVEAVLTELGMTAVAVAAPFEPDDDLPAHHDHEHAHHGHEHHGHEHHGHEHHGHEHHGHEHHEHEHHEHEDHEHEDHGHGHHDHKKR